MYKGNVGFPLPLSPLGKKLVLLREPWFGLRSAKSVISGPILCCVSKIEYNISLCLLVYDIVEYLKNFGVCTTYLLSELCMPAPYSTLTTSQFPDFCRSVTLAAEGIVLPIFCNDSVHDFGGLDINNRKVSYNWCTRLTMVPETFKTNNYNNFLLYLVRIK
jgi:hypothetical protein